MEYWYRRSACELKDWLEEINEHRLEQVRNMQEASKHRH